MLIYSFLHLILDKKTHLLKFNKNMNKLSELWKINQFHQF